MNDDDEFQDVPSGFVLAPLKQAERDLEHQFDLFLRASKALVEMGGQNVAASTLLSPEGAIQAFLKHGGGRGLTLSRLADSVADVVVDRLHGNPGLVASLNEFGPIGSAIAERLGVPDSTDWDMAAAMARARLEVGGQAAERLFTLRDNRKSLARQESMVSSLEVKAEIAQLRSEMVTMAQALVTMAQAEPPAPEVTVAPPDLAGIADAFAAIVLPMFGAIGVALTEIAEGMKALEPGPRRVSVNRDRAGEITDITITEGDEA